MGENATRHDVLSLSKTAREYLARAGHPDNSDTPERIAGQFAAAGLPSHPIVVDAFYRFGGYVLPMGSDGRFTVYRAKRAIRMARFGHAGGDDPDGFRIPVGQSEFIQATFCIDVRGRIYEDDRLIADSLASWIEH
jgi:hypothetical protein